MLGSQALIISVSLNAIIPWTSFQLRSGSSGLIWAGCSWMIVQIFWWDLGPNSQSCFCLVMARLSMGPVAATTPLGCCGTALLGLWQPLAPGLHDPWRVTPFFISPLLNTHHPNPLSTRCPSSSHNAGAIVVTSKVNVGQVLKQFGRGFNISLAVQATDLRSTPGNQLDWPKSELFTASNHQNPGYGEV